MSPYIHPLEQYEQDLRETPAPPPGLPWGYVLGWVVTGLILFSGVWWLVEKAIRP